MSAAESVLNITLSPFRFIFWILSLPLRLLAVIINKLKKKYDPEKLTCPGCGFEGDSGTAHKTCRVRLTKVVGGNADVMLKHTCFRCDSYWFTATFVPANKWYKGSAIITTPDKVKEIVKNGTI